MFKINVYDMSGRMVTAYETRLEPGIHQFTFFACDQQSYLLTVNSTRYRQQRLMIQIGRGGGSPARITYNGTTSRFMLPSGISKSLPPTAFATKSTLKSSPGFSYEIGDRLRFTGYITDDDDNVMQGILSDDPVTDTDYIFHIADMFYFVVETTSDQTGYKFVVDDAVDFEVDWGDGNSATFNGNARPAHDYEEAGEWIIKVRGEASRIAFFTAESHPWTCDYVSMLKDILTPVSDGVTGITSAQRMFRNARVESFTSEDFFDDASCNVTDMWEMSPGLISTRILENGM